MKTLLLLALLPVSSLARYTLGVRDSLMIGHSFHDHPAFGPAGGMHGATYTCDVEFGCEELNPETNWVLDIGLALDILADVLEQYNMKNLDEVFPNGELTTTEFMAQQIHQDLCERLQKAAGDDGVFAGDICVKLWESHKAWASYAAPVPTEGDEEW